MNHVLEISTSTKWMSYLRMFQIAASQINLIAELLQFFKLHILLIKILSAALLVCYSFTQVPIFSQLRTVLAWSAWANTDFKTVSDCSLTGCHNVLRKMTRSINNTEVLKLVTRYAWLTHLASYPYSETIFDFRSLLLTIPVFKPRRKYP